MNAIDTTLTLFLVFLLGWGTCALTDVPPLVVLVFGLAGCVALMAFKVKRGKK